MKAKFFLSLVAIIMILGASGTAYYFYNKYQEVQSVLENPELASQKENKMLIEKLSKLMALPTDEEPTVATVQEKDKIKDQPFFINAENGDKVIIYSKAMKAILYRVSENRIIEVAPISITQPEGEAPQTTEVTPEPTAKATPAPTEAPVE